MCVINNGILKQTGLGIDPRSTPFLLKISIATTAFHRRNNTHSGCRYRYTPSTHNIWTPPGCVDPEINKPQTL